MGINVPKIEKERELSEYYKQFISQDQIIPKHVVTAFKNAVNVIRVQNPLYNEKLN